MDMNRQAAARFFMGVAQAKTDRCEHTLPLFPLVLLLDTEGWLADDAQHLVKPTTARFSSQEGE